MASPIEAQQRGLTREDSFEEYLGKSPRNFNLQWGQGLSASEVLEKIGIDREVIESTAEGISFVTDTLTILLDLVDGLIDILGLILIGALDVFETFIAALKEVLSGIINIFTGISVSSLFHFPQSVKSRRKPDEILYDVGMAYLDKKDSNRPLTISENYGVALLALWSLPDIESLLRVFGEIKRNFEKTNEDVTAVVSKYEKVDESFNLDKLIPKDASGIAPDFKTKNLLEYGAIRDFVDSMSTVLNMLGSRSTKVLALKEIVELVKKRIDIVTNQLKAVLAAIDGIAQLFAFGDANSVLLLSGTGKAEDFSQAIINSPLHKDYPKDNLRSDISDANKVKGSNKINIGRDSVFSGAFLLHAQVADPTANAENILRLFSSLFVKLEQTTQQIDSAEVRLQKNSSLFGSKTTQVTDKFNSFKV
jgi:hypothetical protein